MARYFPRSNGFAPNHVPLDVFVLSALVLIDQEPKPKGLDAWRVVMDLDRPVSKDRKGYQFYDIAYTDGVSITLVMMTKAAKERSDNNKAKPEDRTYLYNTPSPTKEEKKKIQQEKKKAEAAAKKAE